MSLLITDQRLSFSQNTLVDVEPTEAQVLDCSPQHKSDVKE